MTKIRARSLIKLMLVHDHVRSVWNLDATIGQLLYSSLLNELGEYFSCSIVVLHLVLGGGELYLQILDLRLIICLHLIVTKLVVARLLELFLGSSTLRANLEKVSSAAVGRYKERTGLRCPPSI